MVFLKRLADLAQIRRPTFGRASPTTNPRAGSIPTVDLSEEGSRAHRRIVVALALASVLPALVIAYVVQQYTVPRAGRLSALDGLALQALLAFTLLATIVGGTIIWHVARVLARMGKAMSAMPITLEMTKNTREIEALMASVGAMIRTIDEQATHISSLDDRLAAMHGDLEQKNAQLVALSFKDELTGLANRRCFSIRLEEEIVRARRFGTAVSVAMLDLDGFKTVNDELGHPAGDEMLQELGTLLTARTRATDTLARLGGDEFAALLVETGPDGARAFAESLRRLVAEHRFRHGETLTVSIGLSSFSERHDLGPDGLLAAADRALYLAKQAGRNRVVSDDAVPEP
jgi:diguanylate cyclase (GGDEF)-like protein